MEWDTYIVSVEWKVIMMLWREKKEYSFSIEWTGDYDVEIKLITLYTQILINLIIYYTWVFSRYKHDSSSDCDV